MRLLIKHGIAFLAIMSAALLTACDQTTSSTEDPASSSAQSSEVTSAELPSSEASSSEITSSESSSSDVASSEESSSQASSEETSVIVTGDPDVVPEDLPEKITLTGKREDNVITDDYCYVEGERCILYLDKYVDLPGDFAVSIDLIINTLEEKTGLPFPKAVNPPYLSKLTDYLGFNPWKKIDGGDRIPVYVYTDLEDVHYVSCAHSEGLILFMNELISEEIWNSVPSYKDNPWRRWDHITYEVVVHELTHVLTMRYAQINDIMSEGTADYYAQQVLDVLAPVSKDFAGSKEHFYVQSKVKKAITPQNAEEIFLNDYSDVPFAERGDDYTYGRMLCSFLMESYGDTFLKDYLAAMAKIGYAYPDYTYNVPQPEDGANFTNMFKQVFGDDVFKNFGNYYQTHKSED